MPSEQSPSWQLFLQILNMVHSVMEEIEPSLADLKLEPKALFLLSVLDEHPEPAQLAKALLLPKPTVTYLIKKLEASGYVKRASDSSDLRKFQLSLTMTGRNAMEKGQAFLNTAFDRRLKGLPSGEHGRLVVAIQYLQGKS